MEEIIAHLNGEKGVRVRRPMTGKGKQSQLFRDLGTGGKRGGEQQKDRAEPKGGPLNLRETAFLY